MPPLPRLVCIPSRDAAFAEDARRLAGRIPPGLPAADSLAWFTAELRRRHPSATVREQSELARSDNADRVWYVTRRDDQFRIDFAIRVELDLDEAFAVYVDRVAEWQTAVTLTARQTTPDIVGTEYDAAYTFLGRAYHGTLRVVGAKPPRSVSLEATGSGVSVTYTATFEAEAGGTLVHIQGDYTLPDNLLARMADRLGIERAIARDIERANQAYRRLCETIHRRAAGSAGAKGTAGETAAGEAQDGAAVG